MKTNKQEHTWKRQQEWTGCRLGWGFAVSEHTNGENKRDEVSQEG